MYLDDELEKGFNATKKCVQIIDDLSFTSKLSVIQTLIDVIAFQYNIDAIKLYDDLHKTFIKAHKK